MKTKASASKTVFRTLVPRWAALGYAALLPLSSFALSRSIDRDIEFPKDYDAGKAAAILRVVKNERFQFVGGTVSYWEPDYGTRLSFEGDIAALNDFLAELRKLPGISIRLLLYRGLNDEARRDSSWQLDFSKAHPDRLTVYLNLNSPTLAFEKIIFPEWPANAGAK